jgi:hypothetical protein
VSESTTVEEDRRGAWLVRGLYTAAIAANLWLVWDWYRDTPSGQAFVSRCQERIAAAKAKAENCEGCARRKQKLQAAMNRMHFQAQQIVEGEDVETQPEAPA